ncbi:MAG: hypothetical protein H6619_06375 [Deltaproteobacteria bacterium]|nr:hypothetical protein [Deltaproteobacteria bacterium]
MLISLIAAGYFWKQFLGSHIKALAVTLIPFFIIGLIRSQLSIPIHLRIGIGYSTLALIILTPIFLDCFKRKLTDVFSIIIALGSFLLAITMRQFDSVLKDIFPMGTHFLWHLFGGISVYFIMDYVLKRDNSFKVADFN